jgi:hypothetical protein
VKTSDAEFTLRKYADITNVAVLLIAVGPTAISEVDAVVNTTGVVITVPIKLNSIKYCPGTSMENVVPDNHVIDNAPSKPNEVPRGATAVSFKGRTRVDSMSAALVCGVINSTSYSTNRRPIVDVSAQSVVAMKKFPQSYSLMS